MEPRTSLCRNLSLCTITVVIELNGLSPRDGVPAGHAQLDGGRATLNKRDREKCGQPRVWPKSREFSTIQTQMFVWGRGFAPPRRGGAPSPHRRIPVCRFISHEDPRTFFWHAQ